MRISRNTSKWYQNLWAALIFFTRLPFWRVYQPPKESYRAVVEFWPLTGWLTGGVMAAILYFAPALFPYPLVVALAILARVLMTGALHEDGLADFCDGFGGGNDRDSILRIMKDSHIGTYGVLGLVLYFLLLFLALSNLPPTTAALTVLAADPFSKMLAGQVVQMMPYARTEADAKNRVVYRKVNVAGSIGLAFQGLLPILPLLFFSDVLTPENLEQVAGLHRRLLRRDVPPRGTVCLSRGLRSGLWCHPAPITLLAHESDDDTTY